MTLSTKNPKNYSNWDEKLPLVIHSYNAGYHSTVQFPPEYIVFGRVTVSPTDIMLNTVRPCYQDDDDLVENLKEAIRQCHQAVSETLRNVQNETKKVHDIRRKVSEPDFQIGDKVVIKDHTAGKLMYQFSSPVLIIAMSSSTLTVRTERGKIETVHKNRAKRFYEDNNCEADNDTVDNCGADNTATDNTSVDDTKKGSHKRHRSCSMTETPSAQPLAEIQERRHTFHDNQDQTPTDEEAAICSPLRRSRRLLQLPAESF